MTGVKCFGILVDRGLIYFTHMVFLCAIFAIFLLPSVRAYARSEVGTRYGVTRNAALTTNPLLSKGDSWLPMILAAGSEAAFTACSPFLTALTDQLLPSWSSYPQAKFSVRNIWRNSKSDQMRSRKNSSQSSISEPQTQFKPDKPACKGRVLPLELDTSRTSLCENVGLPP